MKKVVKKMQDGGKVDYKKSNLLRKDSKALYTGTKAVKPIKGGKLVEKEKGLKITDNKSGGSNLNLHNKTTIVDTNGYAKGKQSFPAISITNGNKKVTKKSVPRSKVKSMTSKYY
jgi:hypothetical protein